MKEKDTSFEICFQVLGRLHQHGILKQMVLVGSWCVYFYKDYFEGDEELMNPRTRDIDFLISIPPRFRTKVNIPDLLSDLGFIVDIHREGYMRLDHPELIIDFLVPEKGKGSHGPYKIKDLGVNAQPLRFMNLLLDNPVSVKSNGMELTLPHPVHYGFHKLLVSGRRKKKDKKQKDIQQSLQILHSVLKSREVNTLQSVFKTLPNGWKKTILATLKQANSQDIMEALI